MKAPMNQLEEFKQFLLSLLTEARELDKKATNKHVKASIQAQMTLLARQVQFIDTSIKDGTLDMDKAKMEIKVVSTGMVEELGTPRKTGEFTTKIKEIADQLKPGAYHRLDAKGIEWGSFNTRIHNLRAMGAIPTEVKPKRMVNGEEGIFLVKLTKQQMSAEPKRRTKQEA